MKRVKLCLLVVAGCCPPEPARPVAPKAGGAAVKDLALPGEVHLRNVRQLTFGGDNAEAYWSFAGDRLILQSNRKPYQCDQIEILPVAGGAPRLVSTGKGRTTCAYFLKGDQEIIYASTHGSSPACPAPPDNSKGYLWGLFEYDIYKARSDGSDLVNLTPNTKGYDAEATVCPVDGSVVFTSIRSGDLELWRMDADGKNLRQLTHSPGYDGGAFFSADCTKIVWRSSRPTGKDLDAYQALLAQGLVKPTQMDLYVANADGSDARQVTYLPGASFAPYFFPDGKRIIFASNYQNPRSGEFDLFAIDVDGSHLEQITFSHGFDGFPVFSPDGKTLSFSSNRRDVIPGAADHDPETYRATGGVAGPHDTNVFVAEWVDTPAPARPTSPETAAADRFAANVSYLAADARDGRGVGTKGLDDALAMVQDQLGAAGVEPGVAGWRQSFEVTTALEQGAASAFVIDGKPLAARDFVPLAASKNGAARGPLVAAGWGIVDAGAKLDDYAGTNVKGKIVIVHRFAPTTTQLDPKDANRLGDLRYKAFVAKNKGAIALVVVDDGDPAAEEAPFPKLTTGESEAQIPIVVVTRAAGAALRRARTASMTVALERVRTRTSNLIGVVRGGSPHKLPGVVVIGAHIDHLGMGGPTALDPNVTAIHNGADDNASGVAALVEVARTVAARKAELQRDVYFIAFSAEELGVLGSEFYMKNLPPRPESPIIAMLNMDMVGRMKMSKLHVSGGATAKEWVELVGPICAANRVDCTISDSGYGPSDHMPFYIAGVPVLFFFTGSHRDYHTAGDDADKINAAGGARVAAIAAGTALAVANRAAPLSYIKAPPEAAFGGDVRRRGASLGTVPSYDEDPNRPKGVIVSDVIPDGAAAKAGIKGGDRIVQIGTTEVATVPDLMFVLEQAKPGTQTTITFVRDGKTLTVTATFGVPRSRR